MTISDKKLEKLKEVINKRITHAEKLLEYTENSNHRMKLYGKLELLEDLKQYL